jgi:hypothetical protein
MILKESASVPVYDPSVRTASTLLLPAARLEWPRQRAGPFASVGYKVAAGIVDRDFAPM